MKVYNVCWSGGVDSTFIVTQLSQFPVTIRPFYIKGQTFRQSEPQELEAVANIRELLLKDSRTRAELLPLTIIEKDDSRIKNREIIKAHRRIHIRLLQEYKAKRDGHLPPAGSQQIYVEKAYFPPQNVAFASLAEYLGETFEMGTLLYEFKNHPAFQFKNHIVRDELTGRSVIYLSEDNADKDFNTVYRNLCFPIAGQGLDKWDVWRWYEEHGYLQIRSKTIFCQDPIIHEDGMWEPCGVCTACIGVIREGLLEPFTEDGLARYHDYEENHDNEPERFRLKGF